MANLIDTVVRGSLRVLGTIYGRITNATDSEFAMKIGSSSGTTSVGGATMPVYLKDGEFEVCSASGISVENAVNAENDSSGRSIQDEYKRRGDYNQTFTNSQQFVKSDSTFIYAYFKNNLNAMSVGVSSGGDIIIAEETSDYSGTNRKKILYEEGGHGGTFQFIGNAATASALSIPANKGNATTPIYYNSSTGQFELCTPSSMSVSSATNSSYAGKIGSSTSHPSIGSSSKPVYVNGGTVTACGVELDVNISGTAARATLATNSTYVNGYTINSGTSLPSSIPAGTFFFLLGPTV